MTAPRSPVGRKIRDFDWENDNFREGEIQDRNGSLSYVEYEDGHSEWIGNEQIEYLD